MQTLAIVRKVAGSPGGPRDITVTLPSSDVRLEFAAGDSDAVEYQPGDSVLITVEHAPATPDALDETIAEPKASE